MLRPSFYFCPLFLIAAFFLLAPAVEGEAPAPPPPPILLGTAWYPEQWPEPRWQADLALMQQAGIHMCEWASLPGAAWSRATA